MGKLASPERVFLLAVLFFIGWAVLSGTSDRELIFDHLFAAAQVGLLWLFWRKFRFSTPILAVAGLAILLHQLKLYGNTYLELQFDNYMHVIAGFAIALLLSAMLTTSLKPSHSHWLFRAFLIFTTTIGLAAVIEPVEYLGYATVGAGEGILGYGAGDGGWRDTAADMTANMVGSLTAIVVLFWRELNSRTAA